MTHELGRLEDLPKDYVQDLRDLNLVPLWPSLRGVLPPTIPTRQTKPTHWPYSSIKPLLLKAGELTPIEKAERRVLVPWFRQDASQCRHGPGHAVAHAG